MITNIVSATRIALMVPKIVNERIVTGLPASSSGTRRNIARCEDCEIACLVLIIAGAKLGNAI